MQCNFLRYWWRQNPNINRSKSSCVARVSVGLKSKEGSRNEVFGVLPARKMGREPQKEKGGCRKSRSSVFLCSLTARKRFLPRLIKKDNMYYGVTLVTQLIIFIKIKKIVQVRDNHRLLLMWNKIAKIKVCHARIRVTDSGPELDHITIACGRVNLMTFT